MSDYTCTVIINDLDISPKDQKILQKLKKELEESTWGAGNIYEDDKRCEYFDRQILQQNLRVFYHRPGRIQINCGSSIDRDNLTLIEKILKCPAQISLHQDTGKIKLEFEPTRVKSEYEKMPTYKTRFDIPRTWQGWDFEIHGWKWVD